MNKTEFVTVLNKSTLPHVYYSFPENAAPELPYFVWYFAGSDNFGADGIAYASIVNPVIELYTSGKEFDTEATLESILTNDGIYWDKSEQYLTDENMYMVTYEITGVFN